MIDQNIHVYTDKANNTTEHLSTKRMINVNTRNEDLDTPLHLAAYNGLVKLYI